MGTAAHRARGERGQLRVHRPELVDEHGHDTTYAMHMLRPGYQGRELLETGGISPPMREHERQQVFAVAGEKSPSTTS